MATSGAEAWKKYYAGFGDRDTIVKKESNLYDITSANKQIGILPAGSKVLVLATKTFDSKPIITYKLGLKVYKHRIKFADLQKPELKSSNNSPLTSKTIGNKVLTPDGLGLSGKTIKKEYYLSTVKLAINNCNTISPIIKDILNELLIKSINTSSTLTLNIKSISEKDVNIIGKDFGEVTGAWWFLNNYDTDVNAIEFPARSNEPLIDYYAIRKNGLKIKVSAKSNAGAAPALNPVDKAISMIKLNSNEIEIAKFINAIVTNTGVESIVVASKLYSSVAYKEVQRIIGVNNITVEEIESYLLKYTDPKELHQYLTSKLYSKIGRSVPLNSIENIFDLIKDEIRDGYNSQEEDY